MLEQIRRAGHPATHVTDQIAFAAPVAAHRLAIAVVPFRPLGRKGTDLITARTEVPGLGNELDARKHRVLTNRSEERAVRIEAVRPARERGGKIEAEAVDMAGFDPV